MQRNYTVESATRTLPYVIAIVTEIRDRYADDHHSLKGLQALKGPKGAEHKRLKDKIRENAARLKKCQEELLQIGLELKDQERGLVDFPAEFEGRPIHLCWAIGEATVSHWHEVTEGFGGRHVVPDGVPGWPQATAAASRG